MADRLFLCLLAASLSFVAGAQAQTDATGSTAAPIVIGLNADMSGEAAEAGLAIRRGALIAIDEVNRAGGVLGRKFKLVPVDHRGVTARAADNLTRLANNPDVIAVIGGLHSAGALTAMKTIHANKLIYLGSWATATALIENGQRPSYAFRVSVRDTFAGPFLVDAAERRGLRRIGLLLWNGNWGKSNEKAIRAAVAARSGVSITGVERFYTGQKSMKSEIDTLIQSGADAIILVANPHDGVTAAKYISGLPAASRRPVLSHWGITGGKFFEKTEHFLDKVDLTFLQTYSFFSRKRSPVARRVMKGYCRLFQVCDLPKGIVSPVGTAHAYDIVHILKSAIKKAGAVDRVKVRTALERLPRYDGLVRRYDPPFTATRHEALTEADFTMARYDRLGRIIPSESGQ